jgi:Tfp pilus assembly protein PilO
MGERRHLIVVALTVLGVLAFGMFVLKPRASQAADIRSQLTAAESEERRLQDHLETLLEASLHRDEFEASAKEIETLIPPRAALPSTIRRLHKSAIKSGVDLREIAPGLPAPHITVPGAQTIVTTLIVQGDYDRLEAFITRLEDMARATQLVAYTLTPTVVGNRTELTAAMTLEMYVYDPDAPSSSTTPAAPVPAPESTGAAS